MSWLYAVVWSAVAIGLVLLDLRLWPRPAPKQATVEPVRVSEGERR
jgi:hypothetical protein